ncbi:MAG: hypothetical protein Q7V63_05485 [Gammaproteobacteria bacterium]|nr:hypothetical protein [Gammaproteobacteria bacterium]
MGPFVFKSVLQAPKTPAEAIKSRRQPCYGFSVIINLSTNTELIRSLETTRDHIIAIIDPDRASKPHPVRSESYIKQKAFHAAIFGIPPLTDKEEFLESRKTDGRLFSEISARINESLPAHLREDKPFLKPMQFELRPDGSLGARFQYETRSAGAGEGIPPLRSLKTRWDPENKLASWDTTNPLRDSTVFVVLCVIDTALIPADKLTQIYCLLESATAELLKLGQHAITQFQLIEAFDKRTLSDRHVLTSSLIDSSSTSPHLS